MISTPDSLVLVHRGLNTKGVLTLDDPTRRNGNWGLATIAQARTPEAESLFKLLGQQGLWQAEQRVDTDTAISQSGFPDWPIIFLKTEGRSREEVNRACDVIIGARRVTFPDIKTIYEGRLVPVRLEGNLRDVNFCLPETEFGMAVHKYWEQSRQENELNPFSLR